MHWKKCVNEFQWLVVLSRIYLRTLHIRCDLTFVTSGSICFIYFDSLCTTFNLIWMSQRFVIEFIEQKYDWKQAHENWTGWWNVEHTITNKRIKWTIKHAHFDKCGKNPPMHGIICSFLLFFNDKPMLDFQVGATLAALKLETEIYAIISTVKGFLFGKGRNMMGQTNFIRKFPKYYDAIHRRVKEEKFCIFFFKTTFCGFMILFL